MRAPFRVTRESEIEDAEGRHVLVARDAGIARIVSRLLAEYEPANDEEKRLWSQAGREYEIQAEGHMAAREARAPRSLEDIDYAMLPEDERPPKDATPEEMKAWEEQRAQRDQQKAEELKAQGEHEEEEEDPHGNGRRKKRR